jgi:predicted nucleic acid-binding protein
VTNVICNTSPFQYLYQIDQLRILPALAGKIIVPSAVVDEIHAGRVAGVDLPDLSQLDWIMVQNPIGQSALPLISDLGAGESEVLMLALETPGATVILDDMLARRFAESLGIHLTGTLGLLLDAKQAGFISQVRPLLDQLQKLRFRLSLVTYQAVLKLADEL